MFHLPIPYFITWTRLSTVRWYPKFNIKQNVHKVFTLYSVIYSAIQKEKKKKDEKNLNKSESALILQKTENCIGFNACTLSDSGKVIQKKLKKPEVIYFKGS